MLTAGRRGQFPRWCRSRKMLHCNHTSGHLKTEHTESLFLLRPHLRNLPRTKHKKRTAGSAWETWTVVAADSVRCARVRWEINFLLTFKTALFFCVYPVYRQSVGLKVPLCSASSHNIKKQFYDRKTNLGHESELNKDSVIGTVEYTVHNF